MTKFAVIGTGGKQYLVKEGDVVVVDNLGLEKGAKVSFDTLAVFEDQGKNLEIGRPLLQNKTKGELIENLKGDKIRVGRFKSKVRYRKVRGYRHQLSKVRIIKI